MSEKNKKQPEEIKIDFCLDLKGVLCPLNYVKTKLKLEEMKPGEVLEVFLDEGEPIKSVPKSVRSDGHKIISVTPQGACFRVVVRKAQ